jgi:hypothetical protein
LIAKWGNRDRFNNLWGGELGLIRPGELAPRSITTCRGCSEPIHTIVSARNRYWQFCSHACYQRDYRKRRRGSGGSVVSWKREARRPHECCAICKRQLDRYGEQHKRKDAVYCSAKCRQWAYRRRQTRP